MDVGPYLTRLGVEAEPPSVDALFRLHRAHVERVPYETLWIHTGELLGVDAVESFHRMSTQRRGGYCFHLNGAFSELLRGLGYDVQRHVGGVHGPDGPDTNAMTNHLVLSVLGLATDANPAGTWYVDAGLCDALHEPLPLLAGDYQQGPFRISLDETADGVGDWHLTHDPKGSFPGMSWRSAPAEMTAFAERNVYLSTSPESGFVRTLCAQRRDTSGVDILRGLTLSRVGSDSFQRTIESRDELRAVFHDIFDIDVALVDDAAWDALWTKTHAAHVQWVEASRP